MRLHTGFITDKLEESKEFYVGNFGFEVQFESDWFVLLKVGNSELAFMVPNHPSQRPVFQSQFNGKGAWVTLEVEDVDAEFERVKQLGIPIEIELRDEEWGDRHFAVVDPNGIGVDVIIFSQPTD